MTNARKPSFIMFDGIDGSGKTTMLRVFVSTILDLGQTIFDLPEWCRTNHRLPLPDKCQRPDILVSAEPTHAWAGAAIRHELIRNGTDYSPRQVAEAFALDRLMLYQRLLIPLRAAGTVIVQDRGVSTSLVYQAGEHTGLELESILALPGNVLALAHAPDLLVITDCQPEIALARLAARSDKDDDSYFEQMEHLRIHAERFRAQWFRDLWESRGTRIVYLDANQSAAEVRMACQKIARSLLQLA